MLSSVECFAFFVPAVVLTRGCGVLLRIIQVQVELLSCLLLDSSSVYRLLRSSTVCCAVVCLFVRRRLPSRHVVLVRWSTSVRVCSPAVAARHRPPPVRRQDVAMVGAALIRLYPFRQIPLAARSPASIFKPKPDRVLAY